MCLLVRSLACNLFHFKLFFVFLGFLLYYLARESWHKISKRLKCKSSKFYLLTYNFVYCFICTTTSALHYMCAPLLKLIVGYVFRVCNFFASLFSHPLIFIFACFLFLCLFFRRTFCTSEHLLTYKVIFVCAHVNCVRVLAFC